MNSATKDESEAEAYRQTKKNKKTKQNKVTQRRNKEIIVQQETAS